MDSDLKNSLALGIKFFQSKEYDKAEEILNSVLKTKENLPDVHNMLGLIYHEQGKFSSAIKAFTRALELNPNYTEAYLNLAVVSSDTGLHAEAKSAMEKVAQKEKSKKKGELDPYIKNKLANMYTEIGDVYASIGKLKEATAEYEKALEFCPEFTDILVKIGNLHRDNKNYDKAIEIYKKAQAIDKDYSKTGLNLGIAYYTKGEKDKAKETWENVLKKEPQNQMAKTYLKLFKK
jgi:tetratricopeptide (TPR) repeat protein